MKSIIFCDIDGVLNTRNELRRQAAQSQKPDSTRWCSTSCRALVGLARKFETRIVISSSWRNDYPAGRLKEIFASNGIPPALIAGSTGFVPPPPQTPFAARWLEIQNWINDNWPVNSYIAIDDQPITDSDDPHFVHVDPDRGLASAEYIKKCYVSLKDHHLHDQPSLLSDWDRPRSQHGCMLV